MSLAAAIVCAVGTFGIEARFPLGYLLFALVVWLLGNHFFEIVEYKAEGGTGWPAVSLETFSSARRQIGSVFVLALAALGVGLWALERGGAAAAAATLGLVAAALVPASAALLGVTRSAARALNPAAIARTVQGLGADYLVLLLASAIVAAAVLFAFERRTFVGFFAAAYLSLLLGYLIGGFVYERRTALGVHVWFFHEMTRWSSGVPAVELGSRLGPALEADGRAHEAAKIALAVQHLEDRMARR